MFAINKWSFSAKISQFMSEEMWPQILPLYFNPFESLRVDQPKNVSGSMILLLSHECSILPKHLHSSPLARLPLAMEASES